MGEGVPETKTKSYLLGFEGLLHSRAQGTPLFSSPKLSFWNPHPRKRGAWALPILIGNVEFSLSQRECGEGFVLVLRRLRMLRTQEEGMSLGTAQSVSKSCDGQAVTQKL